MSIPPASEIWPSPPAAAGGQGRRATWLLALLLVWLTLGGVAHAAHAAHAASGATQLQRLADGQPLEGGLWVLEDDTDGLRLEDIRQIGLSRFQRPEGAIRNGGSVHAHWIAARLEVREEGPSDWLLATTTTAIRDLWFHGPFDAQGQPVAASHQTGSGLPYDTRPLASERFVYPFTLPGPGVYTVYVRAQSNSPQNLSLSAWHPADFLQWRQHKRLFDGLCYGMLVSMLIYNLLLWHVLRDRSYGWYVLNCGLALLTLASFNGHAAHYLFPDWPWWNQHANVAASALWMVAGTFFGRQFLDTPRTVPRVDRYLLGFAAAAALVAALELLDAGRVALVLNEWLAFSGPVVMTFVALHAWRGGYTPALWYLAGQTLLFAAVMGVVMVSWGVIDSQFLLSNGLGLGVAAEMVVFAIALSSRVRLLYRDRLELQLRATHLAQAAATDPLTGIANRAGLATRASQVLGHGGSHALMLLDLNRFKPINDVHGHEAGDLLLRTVAERLHEQLRDTDTVARLGGDEFAVLLGGADTSEDELTAMARRLGAAVTRPVMFEGKVLQVGTAIGIARGPQDGHHLQALLRAADKAMYRAKTQGAGHAFYERGLDEGTTPSSSATLGDRQVTAAGSG